VPAKQQQQQHETHNESVIINVLEEIIDFKIVSVALFSLHSFMEKAEHGLTPQLHRSNIAFVSLS